MATINIGNLAFTHKGDYASGTAYAKNDVVYYSTNGNAYIAKQATTGNAPTNATYWNQFAQGSGGIWNAGLSLGSAEQIVQVNSAGNALEFAAKPSGGVVQTVYATNTTPYQQGGTTYGTGSDVIVTGSITPTSASNKIIIWAEGDGSINNGNSQGTSRDSFFQISRDISGGTSGTQIVETSQRLEEDNFDYAQIKASVVCMDTTYNTTSQLTYHYQTKGEGGGWDSFWQQNGGASNMILMEVKV
jgi:hypothetical protein